MNRKNIQILLLFTAYYCINCLSNAYFLFGPFYEKFGATPREVGLFFSVYYLSTLLCRPLGSAVMEKLDIKRTMTAGALLSAAASAGVALSLHNAPLLLLMRVLTGVGVSVMIVATLAAQSILLEDNKSRGFGIALFTTGSMFPIATAVPLCEWFLSHGWKKAYVWTPVLFALLGAAASIFVNDLKYSAKSGSKWGRYSDLFRNRSVLLLLAIAAVMAVADAMTISIASLAKELGIAASCFMIAEGVSSVFIRTAGFRFISHIPRTKLAAPSAALMGLMLAAVSFSGSPLTFALCGLLFGLGIGIGFPTTIALVGDILPLRYYPKATGLVLLVIDIGWMLTPMIFGFVSPFFGTIGTFRVIGIFAFAASMLLYYMKWQKMPPEEV
ncbi:MAG: MFS transporter [Synergistes sp.]|nr:MFS transporter [Synergistes sp.]